MKKNYSLLFHPVFLISLLLLLVNDFYLKYAFPNWFTGKLSDFAGLFAFSLFFVSIFPENKKEVLLFCGSFFIWWKSSLSQPLIDIVNNFSPFVVGRTVDYGDLIALIVLPVTYSFSFSRFNVVTPYRTISLNIICLLSLFAFCYTTAYRTPMYRYPPNQVRFEQNIVTTKSEEEVLQIFKDLQSTYSKDSVHYYRLNETDLYYPSPNTDTIRKWTPVTNSGDSTLYVRVKESPYYSISSYTLDGDRLYNLELSYSKGSKKKNTVKIIAFETSAHRPSDLYTGKIFRKYKRHFKNLFK